MNNSSMSLDNAIKCMADGYRVSHQYFDSQEWATIEDGKILFEDGVRQGINEFKSLRSSKGWLTGWYIKEPHAHLKQEWEFKNHYQEYMMDVQPGVNIGTNKNRYKESSDGHKTRKRVKTKRRMRNNSRKNNRY